ncbi:MAG: class E sortase [Actinomycetes bacterium]
MTLTPTRRPQPTRPPLGPARLAMRTLGELLITAGVVVLLFCVYQLFWTNVVSDRQAQAVTDHLRQEWHVTAPTASPSATPTDQPSAPATPAPVPSPSVGTGFAILHVPSLGDDWARPVVEGVGLPELAKGVGHYPSTALPGQVGNFALAGHRATNGEPFAHIEKIKDGDLVYVETNDAWYTYRITKTHLIVPPTAVWVLDPVPGKPSATPTEATITLTTCEPRWASYSRWIDFGTLVDTRPASAGPPPSLSGGQ